MAKYFVPLLAAAILLTTTAAYPAASPDNSTPATTPTAYEMLERYGFPVGVLPVGAQGYDLHPDGSFEVRLPADCNFRVVKKYTLHYSSRIAGSIKNGTISGLEGVKMKILFAWVGIREVDRDGDELKLQVGSISKSSPSTSSPLALNAAKAPWLQERMQK